jgi:FkbM family methyltransferase
MKSFIVNNMPPAWLAFILKILYRGPKFCKVEKLWKLKQANDEIYLPYIRRYGMYKNGIRERIHYMNQRYPLGDLTDALVLDVGAHVGEFAMAVASEAKKVICFEPDPNVRVALKENVKNLTNIEVLPIALSDKDGLTKFYVATFMADSSLFKPSEYSEVIEVKASRLDALNISINSYKRVVLKMDAEGFEPEVLIGAGKWLKYLDQVAIDVSPERNNESTRIQVEKLLSQGGMKFKSVTSDGAVLVMEKEQ